MTPEEHQFSQEVERNWLTETVTNPKLEFYRYLLKRLYAAEASGHVPEKGSLVATSTSGEGGSSPTPSLQIPIKDLENIADLLRKFSDRFVPSDRSLMAHYANIVEGYLKDAQP